MLEEENSINSNAVNNIRFCIPKNFLRRPPFPFSLVGLQV
ncbi:hypothetical protein PORCAN_247 [Porphyromonas crevioricanis JCM 13913]|nr:hypothetical protein PORCAN_247 [Porphyromonas crevioricanis JCM 13913]